MTQCFESVLRAFAAHFSPMTLRTCVFLACVTSIGIASSAQPSVTREFFLERGNVIYPKAITTARDGDTVVAGELRRGMPWATRVSADGKVRWRYVMQSADDSGGFNGALVLDDDSTLLCGVVSLTPSGPNQWGLASVIVRVDATGKPIRETVVHPNNDQRNNKGTLGQWIATPRGIIALGHIYRPDDLSRLWMVFLDKDGNVLADKVFEDLAPAKRGAFIRDNHIFFAAHERIDNRTRAPLATEVTKLTIDGRVVARASVVGAYALTRPAGISDSRIVLVSDLEKQPTNLIVLDDNLKEVRRVSGNADRIYSVETFRLSDGSLASFGSVDHRPPDLTREVAHAAAAFTPRDLARTEVARLETFFFSNQIHSAAWVGTTPTFVVARQVRKIPGSIGGIFTEKLRDSFGVVVSYITVQ